MSELKDCPFCGAPAQLERTGDLYAVKVRHNNDCPLHPVKIPPTFGKDAIIRKWNTRRIEKQRELDRETR